MRILLFEFNIHTILLLNYFNGAILEERHYRENVAGYNSSPMHILLDNFPTPYDSVRGYRGKMAIDERA